MTCDCNKPKRHCGVIPVRTCCPNPTAVTRNEFLDYKNNTKTELDTINDTLTTRELEIKDLDLKKQNKLVAGDNITLTENADNTVTITAASISSDSYTKAETDALLNAKQNTLTAGTNITIDANNVISATGGTTLTAGDGITIANDEVSVNNTIQRTLTAGTNITIDANNEISADAPVVTLQTTDPGEGVALAANNFIGVYVP